MSGHTPGPWNIDPNEALIVSTRISVQFIAMLGDAIGDFGNAWDDPCMTEEVKANARLIAAAPDMREVCDEVSKTPKEAVAIMEREGFVIDNLTNPWQKLAFTFYSMLVDNASKAEAAIAKAEGKS